MRGNLTTTAHSDLTARIRTVLDTYLHRRQAEALALLEQRTTAGRVASGMPAAWLAARTSRPEMLAVDETLYYPARLSDDGDTLTPPPTSTTPTSSTTPSTSSSNSCSSAAAGSPSPPPAPLHAYHGIALATRR